MSQFSHLRGLLCSILCWHCTLLSTYQILAQTQPRKVGVDSSHSSANDPVYRSWQEAASLRSITNLSQDRLVAVGDRGTVLLTRDAGRTWKLVAVSTTVNLDDVHFDGRTVWAVGGYIGSQSGTSQAVLLKSTDGGESWQSQVFNSLPRLFGVQSNSGRLICWGDYSPSLRSSVFVSDDGGQTWRAAVKGLGHAAAAHSNPSGRILAFDVLGRAVDSNGMSEMISTPNRRVRMLTSLPAGWLAGGEGGELMTSRDGANWSDIDLPLQPASQSLCDWQAVASNGNHLWIVGSPGSLVLRSEDGGHTWVSSPTGQSLPLHKLCFIDQQRGWAVGAQGTILATRDGGRSWYPQRQQPTRSALLSVNRSAENTPWPALVNSVWDHQQCTVALALQHDEPIANADGYPSYEIVSAQAARQMGLSEFYFCDCTADTPKLADAKLAMQILTWRPDVLLSRLSIDEPLSEVQLPRSLSEAMKMAESDHFQEITQSLHLKAWRVQKLVEVIERSPGDYVENSQKVLHRSGLAIADILAILPDALRTNQTHIPMRTVWARSQSRAVQAELLGGATLHGDTRLTGEVAMLGSFQTVMGRGQRERMLKQLLRDYDTQFPMENWEREFHFFAQSLPPREAMGTLASLAENLILQGKYQRSAKVLEWIIQSDADSDSARWAGRQWLWLLSWQPRPIQPQEILPQSADSELQMATAAFQGQSTAPLRTASAAVGQPASTSVRTAGFNDYQNSSRFSSPFADDQVVMTAEAGRSGDGTMSQFRTQSCRLRLSELWNRSPWVLQSIGRWGNGLATFG